MSNALQAIHWHLSSSQWNCVDRNGTLQMEMEMAMAIAMMMLSLNCASHIDDSVKLKCDLVTLVISFMIKHFKTVILFSIVFIQLEHHMIEIRMGKTWFVDNVLTRDVDYSMCLQNAWLWFNIIATGPLFVCQTCILFHKLWQWISNFALNSVGVCVSGACVKQTEQNFHFCLSYHNKLHKWLQYLRLKVAR